MNLVKYIIRKKKFTSILFVEAVILFIVGIFLMLNWKEQSWHFAQEDMVLISEDGNISGSYFDQSYTEVSAVASPKMNLPGGIYYVEFVYQTSGPARAGVAYTVPRENRELVNENEFELNPDNRQVSYKLNVKDGMGVYIRLRLTGDAVEGNYVQLIDVNVVRSKLSFIYPIACLSIFFLVLDFLFIVSRKRWKNEKTVVIQVLVVIAFLMGMPLYQDGYVGGIDLPFHMSRIEGIYEGLKAGQFPVRIQPGWLNGYGYAVSVFYGDILLYFPAFLRLLGFTLQDAMKAYLILVNFLTVFSAWFSFRKCLKGKTAALTASILYVGAGDRLARMYESSQIGAVSAMIFYPVVLAGLYLLFTKKENENGKDRIWLWLLTGFSGLLMTHMLSCLMLGIFTALTCAICFKRLLRKGVLKEAGKAFAAWALLNGWFLVPFFQYMSKDYSVTSMLSDEMVQPNYYLELAGYLKDCLDISEIFSVRGLGYALAFVLLAYPVMRLWSRRTDGSESCALLFIKKNEKNVEIGIVFGLSVFAVFISIKAFPTVALAKTGDIFVKLFQTIQYGDRFLSIAVLLLACVGGELTTMFKPRYRYALACVLCVMTIFQSMQMFETYTADKQILEPVDFGVSLLTIGNGEYVPEGTDLTSLTREVWYDESVLQLENVENRFLTYEITVSNQSEAEQAIALPLLYYDGYRSRDTQSGEGMEISAGPNNRVTVIVPGGYVGTLQVSFEEYWYWRVAEVCSLITFLVIVAYSIKKLSGPGRGEYGNEMEETG